MLFAENICFSRVGRISWLLRSPADWRLRTLWSGCCTITGHRSIPRSF